MNKKDILIDFSIHLLLLGNEFHNDELHFFDSREKNETNYENYVGAINKLINVDDFLWDTDVDKPISKIETLNDLLSEMEIEFFQEYIKLEFSFGYPNEINEDGFAWGETFNLDLSIKEIESYFKEYLDLRKLNPNQYITYYQQFIDFLRHQSNRVIETTKNEIDNFHENKISAPTGTYSKLKDRLESKLMDNLLKGTQNTSFQVQGGFDEYGFIFNYDETLNTILKSHNSKYSKLNIEIESKQYYTLIEYEYYLFKIEEKKTLTKTDEQKNLEKEFELIKEKNSKLIEYLKIKDFDNREVDVIINCFCLNKFNSINSIRYIHNLGEVGFFGLFYFFYRFEFLKQELKISFKNQNDFIGTPLTGSINKNDFKKYYDHSDDKIIHNQSHHTRYPFKKSENLLEKIKSELHIDLKKLNLPPQLKKSV